MRLGTKRKTFSEYDWAVARSTADFASTTSMTEARLLVRTASMLGEDTEAVFILFSAIPLDGISMLISKGRRKERGGKGGGRGSGRKRSLVSYDGN